MRDEDVQRLLDDDGLWTRLHEEAIVDHANRRILFFYLQVATCYGTKLVFELAGSGTTHQADQATPFDPMTPKFPRGTRIHSRHAAHSATIPSLTVKHDSNDAAPSGVYLEHSHLHRIFNTTVSVPSFVNNPLDTGIDFKSFKLRNMSLDILNRASQQEVTPEKAVAEFVTAFEENVGKYQTEKLPKTTSSKEGLTEAASYYRRVCQEWTSALAQSADIFAQKLCLCRDPDSEKRAPIHRHAEEALRKRMEAEAALGYIVEAFIDQHFAHLKSELYFHDNFVDYLVKKCESPIQEWFSQHENYPGDLLHRTTVKRVPASPPPPREARGGAAAKSREPRGAEGLDGALIYTAAGTPATDRMWNQRLQDAFKKSRAWDQLLSSIGDHFKQCRKGERTHFNTTLKLLRRTFRPKQAMNVRTAYVGEMEAVKQLEAVYGEKFADDLRGRRKVVGEPVVDPYIFHLHF